MGARSGFFWGTALALAGTVAVPAVALGHEPPIISIPVDGANPSSRAGLLSLLESLRGIRAQLRSLENQVEIENHRINRLRSQQQEYFANFDRQLRQLRGGSAAAGAGPQPPPSAAANPAGEGPSAGAGGTAVTVIPPDTTPAAAVRAPAKGAPSGAAGAGVQASAGAPVAAGAGQEAPRKMYETAFNLLRAGRYRHAVAAFQAFLQAYPKDKRAAEAQYWVAETDYVERDYPHAEQAFKALVTRYPKSKKVPNALLKMGYIAKWQGHPNKARTVWQGLINQYPKTMAAQVARNSLTNLGAGPKP